MSDTDAVAFAGMDGTQVNVLRTFVSEDFSFLRTAELCGVAPEQVREIVMGQRKAVAHLLSSRTDQANASRDTVISMLWHMAVFDPADMVDPVSERPLPPNRWPVELRMAMERCSYNELTSTWDIRFASRTVILQTLLKYFNGDKHPPEGNTQVGVVGTAIFNVVGRDKGGP